MATRETQRNQFLLIYKQTDRDALNQLEMTLCTHFQEQAKQATVTSFFRPSDA